MQLAPEDASSIRHALGLGGRHRKPWRNYYAAEADDPGMVRLEAAGMMRRGRAIPGGLVYFHVTAAGAAAVGSKLPAD